MEEWGSGYKRVIEACRKNDYSEPEWLEQGTSIRVTLFSQKTSYRRVVKPLDKDLSDRQKAILALFKKGKTLPFRTIFKTLSAKISERMLRYELAQLKKKGLIISKGRGPSTVWQKTKNS